MPVGGLLSGFYENQTELLVVIGTHLRGLECDFNPGNHTNKCGICG